MAAANKEPQTSQGMKLTLPLLGELNVNETGNSTVVSQAANAIKVMQASSRARVN
jgi:hypothetical protein